MAAEQDRSSDDNSAVDAILADYMQRLDRGEAIDRAAVLAAHPELADELQELFAAAEQVERMAGPVSDVTIDSDAGKGAAAAPPLDTIRYFGDYELLSEIARGGMGVVYKARQASLNRIVAVKMILAGQLASSADVDRFRAEAEAAANLDHPGIVPIYEIGEHNGQHYFSMGYIDGSSLAARVASGPLPPREAATLVATVAEAVQYAHDHGVIHRDLKPANILLDKSGAPRVTDFGLAKRTQSESNLTATGQILGTPSYMAPEQATAEHDKIGPATDVYALGAILYSLLTGRPPFQAATAVDTLIQVRDQEPVPPRQLDATIPRDLETISLKCIEKGTPQRYPTAAGLAAELRRFLAGEPIQARPISRAARLVRWSKRQPVVAGLTVSLVAALIVGMLVSAFFATDAYHQADELSRTNIQLNASEKQALASADRERILRRRAEYEAARATFEQAWQQYEQGYVAEALATNVGALTILERPVRENESALPELPEVLGLSRGLRNQSQAIAIAKTCPRLSVTHRAAVEALAFSPNGAMLATASQDHTAQLWDAATGEPIGQPFKHGDIVCWIAFSRDGTKLVTASMDKTARLWDVATGIPIGPPLSHKKGVRSAAFSPDGNKVATASLDGTAQLWHATSGKSLVRPLKHNADVYSVAFSPDGTKLATASLDRTARLWDVTSGESHLPSLEHDDIVVAVAFSPEGTKLATASFDGYARLWDVATGKPFGLPLKHDHNVISVAFSPDGARLATASADKTARLWNVATGKQIGQPFYHNDVVSSVAFSRDNTKLVTAAHDKTAQLWNVASGKPIGRPLMHNGGVLSVAFNPDGTRIATASFDRTARLWDVSDGQPRGVPLKHTDDVRSLAFSPNGAKLAIASDDKTARLWDMAAGKPFGLPLKHQGGVRSVAFGPDGTMLATASEDNTARLWDVVTGKLIGQPLAHDNAVASVAFNPDGTILATASADPTARLWDVVSGKQRRTLGEHGYWVSSVAFSPDGTKLATASVDKTARLWDLESGKSAGGPFVHNEAVNFVAFSMDGTKLATASLDKTACLWDLGSGKRLGRPLEHQGEVYAVSFSPDGTMLATASADKSARLWDVATGKPLGPPLEHKECVNSAVFSPDGKTLATGSTNVSERWISTAVQLWRIDSTPTESAEHWVVWASTLTGLVAEPGGTTRVLTPTELADCHARLRRLGGTPKSFLEAVARRR